MKQAITFAAILLFLVCPLYAADDTPDSVAADEELASYPVLSGVGLALKKSDSGLFVGVVVADSPAEKSGKIKAGDQIISVESEGVKTQLDGKSVGDAASLIRGQVGSVLTLELLPLDAKKPIYVRLTRQPLSIAGVASYRSYIGKKAPELALLDLKTKVEIKISELAGKIVVLDFWASWCPTCYAPVERLQQISKDQPDWRGKVELIAVSVDADEDQAIEVVEEQGWDQTKHASVDFNSLKSAGVTVVPVTIIIDANGVVSNMAGSHAINVEQAIQKLLSASATAANGDAPPFRDFPNPGREWSSADGKRLEDGQFSWRHYMHKNTGDVLACVAWHTPGLSIDASAVRQASIETITSTGYAYAMTHKLGQLIADKVRHRIASIDVRNHSASQKAVYRTIEYTYVYGSDDGDLQSPMMAHGYVVVVGDFTIFIQHTANHVITSDIAQDMVTELAIAWSANQTSLPEGWSAGISH